MPPIDGVSYNSGLNLYETNNRGEKRVSGRKNEKRKTKKTNNLELFVIA